ncbi:hypothetical protein CWI84_11505 [Idiomarina tyrosinivorans]|uniref:Prephenate dehydrogenase n=1 Tax=Idiomarina tyrosinivorans TaxID=1445662 RepID=A0A432ZF76_9GAMM|nr:primosomal replication protein PriC [Idiomarina tyrosinivorans]RUO76616.1 hypothetical protein CWI84_11505 [Idiomarina tyrosinivorans]
MNEAQQRVDEQLQNHLQTLYRQVIDADKYLDDLRKEGKAKFQSVFADETLFETKGNKLQPYLQEVTADVEKWREQQDDEALESIVKKLQLLTETVARLKHVRQAG